MVLDFKESIIWEREVKSQVNRKVLSRIHVKEVMGHVRAHLGLLPNQIWVCLPVCSQATDLLALAGGEGKCSIYYRAKQGVQDTLVLKRAEFYEGFQEKGELCGQFVDSLLIGW